MLLANNHLVFLIYRSMHKMTTHYEKYEEAVKILNKLQINLKLTLSDKQDGLGLVAMKNYLKIVGISSTDIDRMKVIHVAGTKGKGSTCAFIESILCENNITTGFFSSPHLIEVRERIRINGKPVSYELFAKYFWEVYALLNSKQTLPGYFYFLTTLALYIFKHECVDAAILEVGIGGEYDCTNVIQHPIVCGITSLGIDHVKILGNSLQSIAWQKAGIFKTNIPAFTVNQPAEAMAVLLNRAIEKNTTLNVVPNLCKYWHRSKIELGLSGNHQKINASLAVQLAYCWLNNGLLASPLALSESFIRGLLKCQWEGRAQTIKFKDMTFYLDGAHTKESIACAIEWFTNQTDNEQKKLNKQCLKVLAFNVTHERKASDYLTSLLSCNFSTAIFTPNVATLKPSNFNDQTNLKNSVEKHLEQVLSNRNEWIKLTTYDDGCPNALVFSSIADAICFMSKKRDNKLFEHAVKLSLSSVSDTALLSKIALPNTHLQVLVVGSLYLVGGYLRVLKM